MRTPAIVLLMLLLTLFSSPAFSLELKNPAAVEQIDLSFRQHGTLALSGGGFDYAAINITTPQNKENQEVSAPSVGRLVDDGRGNKKLSLEEKLPQTYFKYDATGTAKISAIRTYSLPGGYTVPDSAKRYLYPTKNIQSGNAEIRALAREISKGANTDFEKVALLAIWVHNNVNYTISLGTEAKDALWVLNNRKGTCDEFSALFIAFARSIGIPAKYVSGYVYGPDGWQKHAWAEVYLGKWIPVDATWLEAGRLDATHIKFFETDDNYVANEAGARANGAEDIMITWMGDDETNIEISNYREMVPADYNVSLSTKKSGGGADIVVVARIIPEDYIVDKITLEPCTGIDILEIGDKVRSIILEPKKQAVVAWKLSVSRSLDKNKVYTCPITLSSGTLKRKVLDFEVDPRVQANSGLDAVLEKTFFSIGENIRVDVDAGGIGGTKTVGVAADGFFEEQTLESGGKISFTFPAKSQGNHTLYVYDSSGNVEELNYTVQETGSVFIEKIEGGDFALLNSKPEISVVVRNNMHAQQNIRLDVKINDDVLPSQTFLVPAESSFPVNISIPAYAIGVVRVSIRLVADSVEEAVKIVRIYDVPSITLEGRYNSGAKRAEVKLVSEKDEAKNVSVQAGGKTGFVESLSGTGNIFLDIPSGEYDVIIEYEDVAGNEYALTEKIGFKDDIWHTLVYRIKSLLKIR